MARAIPHLPADDLRVAKEFYVSKLGFQVALEAADDGKSGILGLRRGGIHIIVDSPMEGHGRNVCVSLEVEDADAYFDEWSSRVTVLRPPEDEDWGARTFDLWDPFGNTLFMMGPIRQRAAGNAIGSQVRQVTPILNVSDLNESFAWFEKLGWRKDWDYGDPPYFGAVVSGRAEIFLCKNCQGTREPAGPIRSWEGGGTWMSWWLESPVDVDRAYAVAMQHGVVVSWPPTDMPWNVRECHLRHPDGHTMRVGAKLEEE